MTYQNDPNRVPPRNLGRRADGSWGVLPLVAGVAAVLLLALLIFGIRDNNTSGVATRETPQTTAPNRTNPPATTPAPAPAPTPPPSPQK